jgi:uncharacterized protein YndB with AHSA1/START domain
MSREILHSIQIHAEPTAVYDTVATRAGLAAFWTPDVQGDEREGGELSFGFAESPMRLPTRVVRLDTPREIVWDCPGGFPYWEGSRVSWSMTARDSGTSVMFRHTGLPDDQPDEQFGSVNFTWALVVGRLKEVVESGGTPNPALS